MSDQADLDVLIRVREELAGLDRTRAALREGKKEAQSFGEALKQGLGLGGGMELARRGIDLVTSSLKASVGEAFRLAGEIKDQSEALGVSAEAYQVLKLELAQAGVEAARFSMAVNEQAQSLAAARAGAGAAADAYKALGLSAAEMEQLSPDQRMIAVARAVAGATDKTRAFQAAGAILGTRGLPQLLNGLKQLASDGYDKVASAAKDAGRVMGDYTVEQLDVAQKRIDNFTHTTLPVAAGAFIGFIDKVAQGWGALAGNIANWAQGNPTGYINPPGTAKAEPPKTHPSPDTQENHLLALIAHQDEKAAAMNGGLFTEAERRKALLPILDEQISYYRILADLRYGNEKPLDPTSGKLTEAELARYKERNELEAKLTAVRQQRQQLVDTPLTALNRELLDTTGLLENALASTVSSSIGSLSTNLWSAAQGTAKWSDAFRGLGNIAGQVLSELIVKLVIVRPLLSLFGVGDGSAGVSVTSAAPKSLGVVPNVALAGGGSFFTRGPTTLTVGDNPGGIEHVSVTPISGVGRSTLNGQALRMAGGGTALVAGAARGSGAAGDTFHFTYQFNGGVSREEIMGMMPAMIQASKGAVLDAKRRHRDGHR